MKLIDPMQLAQSLGARIAALRMKEDMTQADLASRTGMILSHLQAIERGKKNITLATLTKIANGLNCTAKSLFEPTRPKPPKRGRPTTARAR